MHKVALTLLAIGVLAAPGAAQAGFVLEASLGKGLQVKPSIDRKLGPTNLLIAPGYGLGELIRAELGVVVDLPQEDKDPTRSRELNLRLRPMLVIDPPILPVYGRIIVGVANLLDNTRAFEFGGAIGAGMSLAGIGVFGELGVLPQADENEFRWLLEGRLGAYYAF